LRVARCCATIDAVSRIAIVIGCLAVRAAGAQPSSSDEADRLFDEGRTLAEHGQWADACARFAASFAIDHAVGAELNLGDCNEHQEHYHEAWQHYSTAAAELERTGDDRAAFARKRAAAIEAKLVRVHVAVAKPDRPGLAITIAGRVVAPATAIEDRLDPGPVEIRASVPGQPALVVSAVGAAGATLTFEVPDFPSTDQARRDVGRRGRLRLGYGLAAGGLASAVVAGGLTWKARIDYDDAIGNTSHCVRTNAGVVCDSIGTSEVHSAQHVADVGTGFAIAGAALVVTAAIVYATAPRAATVTPTASTTGVGLVLATSF
jgi:hypothetical protein